METDYFDSLEEMWFAYRRYERFIAVGWEKAQLVRYLGDQEFLVRFYGDPWPALYSRSYDALSGHAFFVNKEDVEQYIKDMNEKDKNEKEAREAEEAMDRLQAVHESVNQVDEPC